MARRVVVTGLGLVTPVGNTVAESWSALVAGKSGAARIQRFDPTPLDVTFACEVKGFDAAGLPGEEGSQALRPVRAVRARRHDAGGPRRGPGGEVPGPARAPASSSGAGSAGSARSRSSARSSSSRGRPACPRSSSRCSSRTWRRGWWRCGTASRARTTAPCRPAPPRRTRSARRYRLIQDGDADVMIAGGAEAAITPLAIAGFANMKALSTRNDDPEHASRPFDKTRDGFVMGDGSGVVVLESLEHAERRGARILGEVAGFGMSADAYHMTNPAPEGRGAQQAMRGALADARVETSAHRLRQRARHLHAAGRRGRDAGAQEGLRRRRPQAGLRLHQVHDRPPARRRGRSGVRDLHAGDRPRA